MGALDSHIPQDGVDPTTDEEIVKGTSLWSDAWKRLRKNPVAIGCIIILFVICVLGFSAPWISENLTHFSRSETHTRLSLQPPGAMDVSKDHPSFDGDKSSFDTLDLDGDGYLSCQSIKSSRTPTPTALIILKGYDPGRYANAMKDLEALYAKMPHVRKVAERLSEAVYCRELELANKVSELHYDKFLNDYDKVTGDAELGGNYQPDGYVTWKEFPKNDSQLAKKRLRGLGLTGLEAFNALDVDGDHIISEWELTQRTRVLRYKKRTRDVLLAGFDKDRDLRISRAEFPGAPELHVFWLGTDRLGRDIMTRVLYGARISMLIAFLTTLVALLIGVTYGSISGYFGGRIDYVMMRFVDVMYGLPYFFVLILLLVMWGKSTEKLFIALGLFYWLNLARVVRGQVLSLKTREFVEAARAVGVGHFGIIFRHLLPNAIGPVVVYSTLLIPGVILSEAFLSFLGLGVQPPEPSWGNMITDGAKIFQNYPWTLIWPGLMLTVTLFAMNFVGDGVRDAIDPKTQKE